MKENINEHDKTKQMMDIIRNGFKTKLMTEAEEMQQQQTQSPAPNNVPLERGDDLPEPEQETQQNTGFEDISPKDSVYLDELEKIKDAFPCRVDITDFKIDRENERAIISGIFEKGDVIPNAAPNEHQVSGIYFTLDTHKYEAPVSDGSVGVDDTVNKISELFPKFYQNFKDDWRHDMSSKFPQLNK